MQGRQEISGRAMTHAGLPEKIGDYQVGRLLGVGGMGCVHEAYDASLKRRVALKFLRADQAADPVANEGGDLEVVFCSRYRGDGEKKGDGQESAHDELLQMDDYPSDDPSKRLADFSLSFSIRRPRARVRS